MAEWFGHTRQNFGPAVSRKVIDCARGRRYAFAIIAPDSGGPPSLAQHKRLVAGHI